MQSQADFFEGLLGPIPEAGSNPPSSAVSSIVPRQSQPSAAEQPRGLRLNNPGNLRRTGDPWQGLSVDQPDPEFASFETMPHGVRAMAKTLQTYQRDHGITDLRGVIDRWAPPEENSTDSYLGFVAERTGLDADQQIDLSDPAIAGRVIGAMSRFETGQDLQEGDLVKGLRLAKGAGEPDELMPSFAPVADSRHLSERGPTLAAFEAILGPMPAESQVSEDAFFESLLGPRPREKRGPASDFLRQIPKGAIEGVGMGLSGIEEVSQAAHHFLTGGPMFGGEEGMLKRGGTFLEDYARETFGDPQTFAGEVGGALGQMGSMLAGGGAGLAARVVGVAPRAAGWIKGLGLLTTGAGFGVGMSALEQSRMADEDGATPDEKAVATLLGGATGLTEYLPLARILGHLPEGNALLQGVKRIGEAFVAEGLQEGGQQLLQTTIARLVYNPEREYELAEALHEAAVGGSAGAIWATIALPFVGRKGAERIRDRLDQDTAEPPPGGGDDEIEPSAPAGPGQPDQPGEGPLTQASYDPETDTIEPTATVERDVAPDAPVSRETPDQVPVDPTPVSETPVASYDEPRFGPINGRIKSLSDQLRALRRQRFEEKERVQDQLEAMDGSHAPTEPELDQLWQKVDLLKSDIARVDRELTDAYQERERMRVAAARTPSVEPVRSQEPSQPSNAHRGQVLDPFTYRARHARTSLPGGQPFIGGRPAALGGRFERAPAPENQAAAPDYAGHLVREAQLEGRFPRATTRAAAGQRFGLARQAQEDIPAERRPGPTRGTPRPQSLAQFLAAQGGVQDQTGELRAMGADVWHRDLPFRARLVSDSGLRPDYAREAAVEAGFLPEDATLADFYAAVDQDVRDTEQPVMAIDQPVEPTRRELERARAENRHAMELEADRLGLDFDSVQAFTDDDLAAAIAEAHDQQGSDPAEIAEYEEDEVDRITREALADEQLGAEQPADPEGDEIPFPEAGARPEPPTGARAPELDRRSEADPGDEGAPGDGAADAEARGQDAPEGAERGGVTASSAPLLRPEQVRPLHELAERDHFANLVRAIADQEDLFVRQKAAFDKKPKDPFLSSELWSRRKALGTLKAEFERAYPGVSFDEAVAAVRETDAAPLTITSTPAADHTDQGPQIVLPGAERISDRALAERRMAGRRRSDKPQRPADEGLFDSGARAQGDLLDTVDQAAAEAEPSPSDAQKEAGNYRKGHVTVQGLDITIENAKGSERSGVGPDGRAWSVEMPAHYGYIKRTEGADGQQVDVYLGESPEHETVFVVYQRDADTKVFDEHKVFIGFEHAGVARRTYAAGFSDGRGPDRLEKIERLSMAAFKAKLAEGAFAKRSRGKPPDPHLDTKGAKTEPAPEARSSSGNRRYAVAHPPDRPDLSGKDPVPIVEVAPRLAGRSLRDQREAAATHLQEQLQGRTFRNADTGWDILVPKSGRKKTTSGRRSAAHMESVFALQRLIEDAVLVESRPDRRETPDIKAVHRLYAPLRIGDVPYRAKLTVFETQDGRRFYNHDLTEIVVPAVETRGREPSGTVGLQRPSGTAMDIGELLADVNYDDGTPVFDAPQDGSSPGDRRYAAARRNKKYPQGGGRVLLWKRGPTPSLAVSNRTAPLWSAPPTEGSTGKGMGVQGQSTEDIGREAAIIKAIREEMQRIAPGLHMRIVPWIDGPLDAAAFEASGGRPGTDRPAAYYERGMATFATRAMADPSDAIGYVGHEVIHYLRESGFFRAREWQILEAASRETWMARYGLPDRPGDRATVEEGVAYAFQQYQLDGPSVVGGPVARVFRRLLEFLKRLVRALRGRETAEDVFRRVSSGAVGRRPVGAGYGATTRHWAREIGERFGERVTPGAINRARGPMYAVARRVQGTAAQEAVLARIIAGSDPKPIGHRIRDGIAGLKERAGQRFRQGLLDQFDAIAVYEKDGNGGKLLDASVSAYKSARLTQNLQSVMHILLKQGMIGYRDGGFVSLDGHDGGFEGIFNGLAERGLLQLWQGWAIANRSQRLIGEGREQLLSQADIDALLPLGRQYPEFQEAMDRWQRFNGAILDLAETAGVIDPEGRKLWERNDYVPFYRVLEDGNEPGPRGKRGLADQRSGIRRLEGGKAAIQDLIENMVMNVTHLVDASFKNTAAARTAKIAVDAGVMEQVGLDWRAQVLPAPQAAKALRDVGVNLDLDKLDKAQREQWLKVFALQPPRGKDIVSVLEDGKPVYYRVDDPMLFAALTSLNQTRFDSVLMRLAGGAKRLLTRGITSFPDFMVANLMRDTIASWVVTGGKTGPLSAAKGIVSSLRGSASQMAIAAAGGGTLGYYGVDPDQVRAEIDLTGSPRGIARRLWDLWQHIGQSAENANRIAVYEKLRKAGVSEAEAAYQAMDLMDFSMHGDATAVRALIHVVPFMNARLQGLYRLARGAADNPAGFALRGAAITAMTLALVAAFWDDERYQQLTDPAKDFYYNLWIGDQHVRLPKPFEVGAIFSTLPERLVRFMAGKDDGERLSERVFSMVLDAFAMDPTPQLVKPLLEQYANKNSFTGAPIVPMGLKRLRPGEQVKDRTSALSRALGELFPETVSPVRMDALIRGYLGTLGTTIMAASDAAAGLYDDNPAPDGRIEDIPVIGRFLRDEPAFSTVYVQDFYELRQEVTALMASARHLNRIGLKREARELIAETDPLAPKIAKLANRTAREISQINGRLRLIREDRALPGAEKRRRIDALLARKNALAQRAVTAAQEARAR